MERDSASNASFLSDDDHEISDLQENEISYEQLENFYFAPGDITWKGKLTICSAGDVIDHAYFLKFTKTQSSFPCQYKMFHSNVHKYVDFMEQLKETRDYSQRESVRIQFLDWFKKVYWLGKMEGSLLDLMEGAHRSFYDLPEELALKWKEKSLDFFRVFSLQGSLLVSFALAIGYVDYRVLKDIYHLPFFFDSALLDNFNFSMISAISEEWKDKGQPLRLLTTNQDKNQFSNHTEKAFEHYPEVEKNFFYLKNLLPVIARHHEKINGSGFPKGVNWSELSDLESLVIFVSQNYGIEAVNFSNENTYVFLNGRVNSEVCNENTLSPRLESMIVGIFKNLDKHINSAKLLGA